MLEYFIAYVLCFFSFLYYHIDLGLQGELPETHSPVSWLVGQIDFTHALGFLVQCSNVLD